VTPGKTGREYGPYVTVFNRCNRWSKRGLWQDIFAALAGCSKPPGAAMIDGVRAHRAASGQRGERGQAIGRSRGGRTTKVHALIDHAGRPLAFRLTGGNIADLTVAAPLLYQLAPSAWLIGDKSLPPQRRGSRFRPSPPQPARPTRGVSSQPPDTPPRPDGRA